MSVTFQPYQPREQLSESLSAADVHLVTLRPELEGLIVPSKVYGIAAAGRPVIFIGDKDGEVARLLATFACGVTIAQGDAARLAATVISLARNKDEVLAMGTRARAAGETHFDKRKAVTRWRALFKDLCAPRRS